jgi:hypothetical protein
MAAVLQQFQPLSDADHIHGHRWLGLRDSRAAADHCGDRQCTCSKNAGYVHFWLLGEGIRIRETHSMTMDAMVSDQHVGEIPGAGERLDGSRSILPGLTEDRI